MSITLLQGDCLEVMKNIPDASIDLIICDLPYGCLTQPRATIGAGWRKVKEKGEMPKLQRDDKEACAWDIKLNLELFWKEIKRIRKSDHSPCIHFCTTKFGYELIQSNPDEFRYDLVWDKQRGVSFLSANKMPMRSHEMIYVFSKAGAYYNRKDIECVPYVRNRKICKNKQYNCTPSLVTINNGTRCVLSVISISLAKTKKRGGHPTEKPVELYKWLIERYCPPGGTILDPTAGSFNSCFTAYELDRHAIGIEKDDAFYKKASEKADTL